MKKILTLLILGAGLALSAQEVRFGVQGALSFPSHDLGDRADTGLQVGGHALWDLARGRELVARVDATSFGQNHDLKVRELAIGADYLYHFEGRPRGAYALAGLAAQSFHTSRTGHSSNDSGLGVDLGAGYDLNRNLGLQARFTTTSLSSISYDALNLGVTYTF